MERYRCKLCLKKFGNGKALGGHMRSHMRNLSIPPKPEHRVSLSHQLCQLNNTNTESASSSFSSSSSSSDEEEEKESNGSGQLGYGLRENPKKSIRWVDHHFSFAVDAGSVVLQYGDESETESSKNPTRPRSKRAHREPNPNPGMKRVKPAQLGTTESSWVDPEPVSSISDTTSEEDVAYCLIMLSRDKWDEPEHIVYDESLNMDEKSKFELKKLARTKGKNKWTESEHICDKIKDEDQKSEPKKHSKARTKGKYKCESCDRVFKSYQALGGHRASHKKIKSVLVEEARAVKVEKRNVGGGGDVKLHECPVCLRVFSSGQALGGHKRSHVITSSSTTSSTPTNHVVAKYGEKLNLIDLNLPAPIDDDSFSQVLEFSAVSDDPEIFYPDM